MKSFIKRSKPFGPFLILKKNTLLPQGKKNSRKFVRKDKTDQAAPHTNNEIAY